MERGWLPLLAAFLVAGCINPVPQASEDNVTEVIKTNGVLQKAALICNLTKVNASAYDGWSGACPGTDVDAKNFARLCSAQGISYVKLENNQCTSQNIINNFVNLVKGLDPNGKNNLLIFYYSGHGGQLYNPNEPDGLDETLCFWDGQMRDDVIWKLFQMVPDNTRIWFVTDCCNSGSNYQLPYVFKTKKMKVKKGNNIPRMIHYGGCNDGESSYGSSYGGVFTLYLKKTFNTNLSYKEWFEKAKSGMAGQDQVPTYAETGVSFANDKIFQ